MSEHRETIKASEVGSLEDVLGRDDPLFAEGPVQGGGDTEAAGDCECGRHEKRPGSHHAHDCPRFYCRTEPEPDVLERLRDCEDTPNYLPDGLLVATIKELELQDGWREAATDEVHDLTAQLRAITEAEPAAWRTQVDGYNWDLYFYEADARAYAEELSAEVGDQVVMVEPLIVKPKGDEDAD